MSVNLMWRPIVCWQKKPNRVSDFRALRPIVVLRCVRVVCVLEWNGCRAPKERIGTQPREPQPRGA